MNFLDLALREWNGKQPAWTKFKTYEQLTPAEQSVVDGRAEEAEFLSMLCAVSQSIQKTDR